MSDTLLNTLESKNLKSLSIKQLHQLAHEIRDRICRVLSVTGGHLASNLGAVELTIALHKVFDSPSDKFIFDVSHQTYVHKLLTGRNHLFERIRQYKGLCGFSNPKESEHDHFYAGHAGTALSLGLGSAKMRDLTNDENYVIPIIGDATLTCGTALEALNNISRSLKKFIVILNDNNMSISENVGAITHILSRFLSNLTTNKWHQELDTLVSKIPSLGKTIAKQSHKLTGSLKNLVSPAAFFEQYGLSYIGPIDGHDIQKLIEVLEGVKNSAWPVIIHVLTKKGQGMQEAIDNPVSYHGAKPFNLSTGQFLKPSVAVSSFPKIFGQHILKMAEKDEALVAITPAMSAGSCLDEMMKKFPKRCLDVGIAESHAVTFAGGLAKGGKLKILVSIYATFLQRAFDNVFHDVCLQELPVVFAIDRAGISGPDGSTHHGIYDIPFLNAMPNMVICQPRNGHVLKELMESAFAYNFPTAIRYPNMATEESDALVLERPLGKGEILLEGEDVLIIGLGVMNNLALKVANNLQKFGFSPTVLDPVFIKPLDEELFHRLLKTHKKIVTIEEHSVVSGMGSIISHFLMKEGFAHIDIIHFGIPERYLEQGQHQEILNEIGLTEEKITEDLVERFLPKTSHQLVLDK